MENLTVEYLRIAEKANSWGWFVCSGHVNGEFIEMRYDRKPKTKKKLKADLIAEYEAEKQRIREERKQSAEYRKRMIDGIFSNSEPFIMPE